MGKKSKTTVGPASIQDLPVHIFHLVLLKLSTISILVCKCVCKAWRDQISDLQFNLHFAKISGEAYPLLQPYSTTRVSRSLYLIAPDRDQDTSQCHPHDDDLSEGSDRFVRNVVELKIPLRNAEEVVRNHNGKNSSMRITSKDHQYDLVNSCDGFLLLAEKRYNDPVVVCNPVTGEFINLPEASKRHEHKKRRIDCGFGFSPKTGVYKVVRIAVAYRGPDHRPVSVAEILTLGEGCWKEFVGKVPNLAKNTIEAVPVYLKGVIFWLYVNGAIMSFDLESEKFLQVLSPRFKLPKNDKMSMGVLGGRLCVCEVLGITNVWVMEGQYGARNFWVKKIVIHRSLRFETLSPLKYFKNEGFMIINSRTNALLYYHRGQMRVICGKHLREGFRVNFQVIAHVPSLAPLKDILVEGNHVQVRNINSRCGNLRLWGEAPAVILNEELSALDLRYMKWLES